MYSDNLVGMVLGDRYEILEKKGTGGMATVYKAHCRLLNRYVAIKVLKESLKTDPEIVKKFSVEAKAAAGLSHHNIVSVFDVGETDGLSYIVMEYVDGITLKEYLNKNKVLDWRQACNFAIQIGLALEHAHKNGIIHRDIKPHNILVTDDLTLKVADFGIARAVSSETVVAGGDALGSVHYISPEQARGGYTDARSDIYSLGVVMYEMLTGRLPFDGDNPVSIAIMKLEKEPVDCKVINLEIPQEVSQIVMKAMAREQHARYQTVMDMVVDLKSILESSQVERGTITGMTERIPQIPVREQPEETQRRRLHKGKKKKDKLATYLVVGSILLVLVLAGGTFAFMNWGKKEVQVPNLLNKTLEEALVEIKDTDFEIDEASINYEVSEEYEEGRIMLQNPGANTYVKKNTKIKLTISSGTEEGNIPVPELENKDFDAAVRLLKDAGLEYEKIEEESSTYELNYVISQVPKAGTKVSKGYKVILHVCTSKPEANEEEKVPVPNVVGGDMAAADKKLKAVGLKLGNVKKEKSNKPEGTVISQNPTAGSESPKGSYVNIVISEGQAEEPTQTPEASPSPTPNTTKTDPPKTQEPSGEPKRTNLTVVIPDDAGDTVQIKVVANGKTIYDKAHSKSDGQVVIPVESTKDSATVETYINGQKVSEKVVRFD